jgi:hypothetical protein
MDSSPDRNCQSPDSPLSKSNVGGGVHDAVRRIRGGAHRFWNALHGRQQVHMLHIGKTGGTAVKASLCEGSDRTRVIRTRLGRVTNVAFRQPSRRELFIRLYPHSFTLRDVPVGEKVFFFLRDPIARFVSGFYSRQRQGQPRVFNPWTPAEAEAFARFETPNALAAALASRDPSVRSTAEAAMRGITHVRSSYWDWFHDPAYFQARLGDILLIGFQETLDSDFETLKSLLSLPPGVRLPTDAVASHRSPAGLDRTLDGTSQVTLREWYARDYEFMELCRPLRSRSLLRTSA